MTRHCQTCRYADPVIDSVDGSEPEPVTICRRYPPISGWSTVDADDWCGEWKAQTEVQL